MSALTLVLVVLSVACGMAMIFLATRRLRTPPELRGDWWSDFEREFRAYAARTARPPRRRRPGDRA